MTSKVELARQFQWGFSLLFIQDKCNFRGACDSLEMCRKKSHQGKHELDTYLSLSLHPLHTFFKISVLYQFVFRSA